MSITKVLKTTLLLCLIFPLYTCKKYDDGKWHMRNFWKRQMTGEFDITSISIDGKEYIEEYARLYGAKPRAVITKGRYGKPRGGWYPNMEDDFEVTLKVEYFRQNEKVWMIYWRPEPEHFPESFFSSDSESRFQNVSDDTSFFLQSNAFQSRRYYLKSSQRQGFEIYSKGIIEKKDSLVLFNETKNCEIHYTKIR